MRERVRREGVDLASEPHLAERYVRDAVRAYAERALGGAGPLLADEASAAREVSPRSPGFGPLQPYLDDPTIEEIWVNAPSRVFVARDGVPELTPPCSPRPRCATWSSGCCSPPAAGSTFELAVRRRLAARRLAPARRDPRRDAAALGVNIRKFSRRAARRSAASCELRVAAR